MAVMASRRRRRRGGVGKRARRLSSLALASKLAGRAVATAMAKWMSSERPRSGRRASEDRGTVSERAALATESNQIGPKYEQSDAVASQQQRLKFLGYTVGVCYTNMREPLAKQCPSKTSSNNVIDKQIL